MNATVHTPVYELRFRSLFDEGRALAFPCDAFGQVDLDSLSERARNNYIYARAVVGRDFAVPAVLPTIALLKDQLDVIELNGPTDYRRRALHDVRRYLTPLGPQADDGMAAAFRHLVPEHEKTGPLDVNGRVIAVRHRGSDVAWFDFDALCRTARSALDYLDIAERFHTVLLSGVPRLSADEYDVAHRFMNLIDVFYDQGVNLVVSAATPPDALYAGERMGFEFQRTVSRLIEMQSDAWPGARRSS